MFRDDADREEFFQAAAMASQYDVENDPTNALAFVRWGGSLLEIAHYKQGVEAIETVHLAILKLKYALEIDHERIEAEWCLGNAYTTLGFLCPVKQEAMQYFHVARNHFINCWKQEQNNESYLKAVEMCDKAPDFYDEIQQQLQTEDPPTREHQQSSCGQTDSNAQPSGSASKNNIWWNVAGYTALGIAVVATVVLVRTYAQTPATKPA